MKNVLSFTIHHYVCYFCTRFHVCGVQLQTYLTIDRCDALEYICSLQTER